MNNILEVNCPTCSKVVEWLDSSTFRPFCSDRCKQIDLGEWASESYAIPTEARDEWELAEQHTQLHEENQQNH
tara:strand:- start:17492 stop:17710 length:219 start_codon:yes stop_codon:yes gene_type:complete